MPQVEGWWVEQLRVYDKDLDMVWDENRERFVVTHRREPVMIVQDGRGRFLRPHPNLILHGDTEIGVQGLIERDGKRYRSADEYLERIDRKNVEREFQKEKARKDKMKEQGKEAWHTGEWHSHAAFPSNPLSKKEVRSADTQ